MVCVGVHIRPNSNQHLIVAGHAFLRPKSDGARVRRPLRRRETRGHMQLQIAVMRLLAIPSGVAAVQIVVIAMPAMEVAVDLHLMQISQALVGTGAHAAMERGGSLLQMAQSLSATRTSPGVRCWLRAGATTLHSQTGQRCFIRMMGTMRHSSSFTR